MKRAGQQVRVRLSGAVLDIVDQAAERSFRSRTDLLACVVGQWVKGARSVAFSAHPPCNLSQIGIAQRTLIEQRKQILDEWRQARIAGARRGVTLAEATCRFLGRCRRERGIWLSASTLYNWDRRYRSGGLLGLLDRRAVQSGKNGRLASGFRRGFKRPLKAG